MKKIKLAYISLLFFIVLIKISIAEPPEPPPLPPPISFPEGGSTSPQDNAPEAGSSGSSPGEGSIPEPGLYGRGQNEDTNGADGGGECKPCNEAIQEYIVESKGKDIFLKLSIILNLMLIVLNSILIVLLLKFLLQHRKNEANNSSIQQQYNQKASSGLKSYIKNYLDGGYSPEAIRKQLLKNRFSGETISDAFNELKYENKKNF